MYSANFRTAMWIAVLFLALFLPGCSSRAQPPAAARGILDLSGWNFLENGSVDLKGEWEFYWHRLLPPEAFYGETTPEPDGFIRLPRSWNGLVLKETTLGAEGFATFRLRVDLPMDGSAKSLRILNQSSAYTLWVNGTLTARNGRVGKVPATSTPQYRLQEACLPSGYTRLDCVLQVSNFSHRKGGAWNPIRLGTESRISRWHNAKWGLDFLLFGGFLIMAIYHTGLFILRRNDPSTALFAMICGLFALRVLVTGNCYMTVFFPDIPWEWMYTLELLTATLSPLLFILFFKFLFPGTVPKPVAVLFGILSGSLSLTAVAASARFSSHVVTPNQFVILFMLVFMLVRLAGALGRGESGAGIILGGFGIFFLTVVHDILNANKLFYNIHLSPPGLFVMIISQSFVLSLRFSNAFKAVEKLSGELEKKNIALARLDRLKDEFLANTSHELRTPLNGIIGIAESVAGGALGSLPKKVRENLSLISSSGRHLASLINDILDHARLKNMDIRLNKRPVDIRTLTDTVLTVSASLARGKNLVLANEIPHDLPLVEGDEARLQQILYNLVGNAVKFTEAGKISVGASPWGSMVEVRVADTGIGIPAPDLERIFDSFEMVDASASKAHDGTGLGLSITRQLVALHGGEIRVESRVGKGSAFRFTIPAAARAGEPVPVPAPDPGGPPASEPPPAPEPPGHEMTMPFVPDASGRDEKAGKAILVVDDDPVNLQVVANHLSFLHIRTEACTSGQEALERISGGMSFDLVLLDVMMPYMSGYEVCRKLRKTHGAADLPVIMLTARHGAANLVAGLESGANDYLTKPFSKDELLARVRSQLDLKQAREKEKENLKLRRELTLREQTILDLKLLQQKLSGMLHAVDAALVAVNPSHEISFCNRTFENMTGYSAQHLLGQPVREIFPDTGRDAASRVIAALDEQLAASGKTCRFPDLIVGRPDGNTLETDLLITPLEIDDELLYILAFKTARPFGPDQAPEIADQIKNRFGTPDTETGPDRKRRLAVSVMTLSLEYWTVATGTTKVELADRSRIWNIYFEKSGSARTQTLDRYLSQDKLPKNPRWNQVLATADFVLAACDTPSPLREELEAVLIRFRSVA